MAFEAPPWHAAFPKPKNSAPESITRSELLEKLRHSQQPGRDFLLIDLRRTDHEVHQSLELCLEIIERLTRFLGRNHPRLAQSASSKSVQHTSHTLQSL